jgi:hypothetical protein
VPITKNIARAVCVSKQKALCSPYRNIFLEKELTMNLKYFIQALKMHFRLEAFLLIPIIYLFSVSLRDRDFAGMAVTVLLVGFAWFCSIVKSIWLSFNRLKSALENKVKT